MVDYGTVPAWVAAIGTIGAFATGGWVLLREIGRGRLADEQRARDQANKVACWGEAVPEQDAHGERQSGKRPQIRVFVMNGSDLPVYDAVIVMRLSPENRLTNVAVGFVPARSTRTTELALAEKWWSADLGPMPVVLGFIDSANVEWFRDQAGVLYRGTRRNWDDLAENGVVYTRRERKGIERRLNWHAQPRWRRWYDRRDARRHGIVVDKS